MKIGYDAQKAVTDKTGLGDYSRQVIELIANEFPTSQLYLYTPKLKKNPLLEPIKKLHNAEFHLPAASGLSGSLWRTFGVSNNLRPDKVDIYHGLCNELPLNILSSGVPSVVTVHDLAWRHFPERFNPIQRFICDFKCSRSVRNATRVIASSEGTKNDIVEFYGVNPDKIDVICSGDDPNGDFTPAKMATALMATYEKAISEFSI